jgi:hypothetical protein
MPGGVGVDLEPLGGVAVLSFPEHARPARHGVVVRCLEVPDVQVEVDLLLRLAVGPVGGAWFGASWTPNRDWPSTSMLCQSSSRWTVPPSSRAQKELSASRSAASNTTIWRLSFTAIGRIPAPTVRRRARES